MQEKKSIPQTNAGNGAPGLRIDIVRESWLELPDEISMAEEEYYEFFVNHGFAGVQNGDPELCRKYGLRHTSSGKIYQSGDTEKLVELALSNESDCLTLHAGTGLEDDDVIDQLVEDILETSHRHSFPVFLETHRATITQDMYRTIKMIERFPEIRFNGDFSHWYTGQEMRYGQFSRMEEILKFIQPVFDRVRFLHGRIGNGGCMQRDITDPLMKINIDHFKQMWIRSLRGFLKHAKQGDYLIFAPELLGVSSHYAVQYRHQNQFFQEGNRLNQILSMKSIIEDCWKAALESSEK